MFPCRSRKCSRGAACGRGGGRYNGREGKNGAEPRCSIWQPGLHQRAGTVPCKRLPPGVLLRWVAMPCVSAFAGVAMQEMQS